jgi:hypothetical protein
MVEQCDIIEREQNDSADPGWPIFFSDGQG